MIYCGFLYSQLKLLLNVITSARFLFCSSFCRSIIEPVRNTGFRQSDHFHLAEAVGLDAKNKVISLACLKEGKWGGGGGLSSVHILYVQCALCRTCPKGFSRFSGFCYCSNEQQKKDILKIISMTRVN